MVQALAPITLLILTSALAITSWTADKVFN